MHVTGVRLHHISTLLLPLWLAAFEPSLAEQITRTAESTSSYPANTSPSVQQILEHHPVQHEGCSKPIGPIETTLCDYESVESVKDDLYSSLDNLVKKPFFKYFRTDLYRDCPFWDDDALCTNTGCIVTTVDESEIPPAWRAEALSRVEPPTEEQRSAIPGCFYRDSDFCFIDDATADGEYFDLTENPERFTGYSGPSAHRVWASIYEENCFGISEQSLKQPISQPQLLGLGSVNKESHVCEEKRVYYRIISGLHASISTHLCRDFLDQSTGKWGPNLQCFVDRIASHPERLQHVYFNTVLLLRAISRLSPYLGAYDYCSTPEGVHEHQGGHIQTKQGLESVMAIARRVGRFDETALFQGENANILKEEFKKHFRNVSRIMDCVGCTKCQLWGKVQVSGIGTALKVLFELDEKALDPKANTQLLQRSEVVALINTLHRFTESLVYVDEFRQMWAGKQKKEKDVLMQPLGLVKTTSTEHDAETSTPAFSPGVFGHVEERTLPARLRRFLEACGRSTANCVQMCAKVVGDMWTAVGSIFTLSGKEQGPRSDL